MSGSQKQVLNMDDIEHQKENIQPLPSGRRTQTLAKLNDAKGADHIHEDTNARRERERETRERQLKFLQDTDDDPLDAYYQYILWIDQAYPTRPKFYMEIVEETVRRFRNDARYKDDVRFVRLWMKVAKIAPEPLELFKYLSVKGIGQNTCLFYEEYAALLETSRKYDDAKEIYGLGIQRKAAPVERLKMKYKEFESRYHGLLGQVQPLTDETDSRQHGLSVLHDSSEPERPVPMQSRPQPRGVLKPEPSLSQSQRPVSKIQVYKDENDETVPACERLLPDNSQSESAWAEAPRSRDQMKENTREATKWVGETLISKGTTKPAAKMEKIQVYRDEEDGEQPSKSEMRPGLTTSALSEVKSIKKESTSAILQGIEGQERKKERLICDLNMLYKDGSEISIEEAKVARLNLYYTRPPPDSPEPVMVRKDENMLKTTVASPTINTKVAMMDVFGMFNQPLTAGVDAVVESDADQEARDVFEQDDHDEENVVWKPTDDETISASVFRPDPESLKISVFHDNEQDVQPFEEESIDSNEMIKQLKAEFEANQGEQQVEDEDFAEESFVGGNSFAAAVSKAYSTSTPKLPPADMAWSRRRPPLDMLTPITEVSNESDRTFGGQSTIRSRATSRLTLNSQFEDSIAIEDTMARFHVDRDVLLEEDHVMMGCGQYGQESNHVAPDPDTMVEENVHDEQMEEVQTAMHSESFKETTPLDLESLDVLVVDSPCNPMNPGLRRRVMTRVGVPPDSKLYLKLEFESGIGDYIEQASRTAHIRPVIISDLDGAGPLTIAGKIGEGGYGSVYKMTRDLDVYLDDDDQTPVTEQLALKIQKPPSPWEYYILYMLDRRLSLSPLARDWFVRQESCHVFSNESCLLMKYYSLGSLLDCVNKSTKGAYGSNGGFSPGVDELLVAFWTVEILKMVDFLHSASVIHGDVKIDNFLLRMPEDEDGSDNDDDWDHQYRADGSGGWSKRGLVLIDWGMAIDLKAFPENQMFSVPMEDPVPAGTINSSSRRKSVLQKNHTSLDEDPSIECYEVRHDLPWKFEPDWYGVAGVIHVLLFGQYIKVTEDPVSGTRRLATPLKRYWQTQIWQPLFDQLLSGGRDVNGIAALRTALQDWLAQNCNKGGKSLGNLLRRVESAMVLE